MPTFWFRLIPLTFEAQEVRRLDSRTYLIEHAWITVCDPDKPSWKFFTPRATLHVNHSAALVNANFRLFRIPLFYLPYATAPAGNNLRQSGFLLPEFSDTSLKGVVLGDGYYWAPERLGGCFCSARPCSACAAGSKMANSAPSLGKTWIFRRAILE